MSEHFPDLLDPRRFADLGKRLSGRIAIAAFSRMVGELADTGGDVEFELEFSQRGRFAVVRGWVRACLQLQCQRCCHAMPYQAAADIQLAVVDGLDEVELLPEAYDPLLLEAPTLKLVDLLEDELILSLPQVPMHPVGECQAAASDPEPQARAEPTSNPFAALAELKKH